MTTVHIQSWALAALVDVRTASGVSKADLARTAEVTPAHFGDLVSGRRAGANPDVRARLADALDVDVRAITCWCDDRNAHRGGRQ